MTAKQPEPRIVMIREPHKVTALTDGWLCFKYLDNGEESMSTFADICKWDVITYAHPHTTAPEPIDRDHEIVSMPRYIFEMLTKEKKPTGYEAKEINIACRLPEEEKQRIARTATLATLDEATEWLFDQFKQFTQGNYIFGSDWLADWWIERVGYLRTPEGQAELESLREQGEQHPTRRNQHSIQI